MKNFLVGNIFVISASFGAFLDNGVFVSKRPCQNDSLFVSKKSHIEKYDSDKKDKIKDINIYEENTNIYEENTLRFLTCCPGIYYSKDLDINFMKNISLQLKKISEYIDDENLKNACGAEISKINSYIETFNKMPFFINEPGAPVWSETERGYISRIGFTDKQLFTYKVLKSLRVGDNKKLVSNEYNLTDLLFNGKLDFIVLAYFFVHNKSKINR